MRVLTDSTCALLRPWRRVARVLLVIADRACQTDEGRQAGAACPTKPLIGQGGGGTERKAEGLSQLLFGQVGALEWLVGAGDVRGLRRLPPCCQVFGVLPQRVARALHLACAKRLAGVPCVVPHLATNLVECVARPRDDMERIKTHRRLQIRTREHVLDP